MKKIILPIFLFFSFLITHAQDQFSVFFDSNKWQLTPPESASLQNWILQNTSSKIVAISGFCDEDGATTFNDSLASKRVDFVFKIIKDKVKIRADFKTQSFGELHQQLGTKAQNRKVTLFFLKEKDLAKESEILGIKPKEVIKPINYPEKIVVENPNGSQSEYVLDANFMKQLNNAKAGEKIKIENLNFVLNTFAVVNESRAKLYELLVVMQQNTKLKISIHGHLCCMLADKQNLSGQRAKAVYKFLEFNQIDKSRMSYKGLGTTQPLYPIPEKTEAERAANRRVEIEIVDN
jgi:outer membrane protein OmpA-like peptidoglycan-associated protein